MVNLINDIYYSRITARKAQSYFDNLLKDFMSNVIQEELLQKLNASDVMFFGVYNSEGINTGVVSKAVLRKCIEAGYVFDLDYVPEDIVNEVNPIDLTDAWYPGKGCTKRIYERGSSRIDHIRMAKRRQIRDNG